jgi:hypothetical protein
LHYPFSERSKKSISVVIYKGEKLNNEMSIAEFKDFLTRYHRFFENLQLLRTKDFKSDFNRVKSGLVIINRLNRKISKLSAESFNIFNILDVGHLEVKTHSTLLAELLNPNGCHGQGILFLETFFETCADLKSHLNKVSFPLLPQDLVEDSWFVDREKTTPFGNMDIVISNSSTKQLVVIENKIYATEQNNQISRYAQWVQSKLIYYPHSAVLFLTLDKRPAESDNGYDYFMIGYKQEIKEWLEKTLGMIQPPKVSETIRQYIDLLYML